jgi:hypothetical protein
VTLRRHLGVYLRLLVLFCSGVNHFKGVEGETRRLPTIADNCGICILPVLLIYQTFVNLYTS